MACPTTHKPNGQGVPQVGAEYASTYGSQRTQVNGFAPPPPGSASIVGAPAPGSWANPAAWRIQPHPGLLPLTASIHASSHRLPTAPIHNNATSNSSSNDNNPCYISHSNLRSSAAIAAADRNHSISGRRFLPTTLATLLIQRQQQRWALEGQLPHHWHSIAAAEVANLPQIHDLVRVRG